MIRSGVVLHKDRTASEARVASFVDLHFEQLKNAVARVFVRTTDTTDNNSWFGMKLEDMGICQTDCTDHVIKLTCNICHEKAMSNAFGDPFVVSVKEARDIVKFFNSSTQAKEKHIKKQALLGSSKGKPEGVVLDIITHSSGPACCLMIECLILIKHSSVLSERFFSVASPVVSSTPAGLDPAMAGKLLCVSINSEWWENESKFDKLTLNAKDWLGCC